MDFRHAVMPLIAGSLLALTACGGSGNSQNVNPPPTNGPSAVTTIGKITGFGSIYVNGVEYDTNGSSYEIDDQAANSDADLSVGMVVKVSGSVNPDGRTGTADSIEYDDEIEGRVENLAPDPSDPDRIMFNVLRTTVIATTTTRFEAEDDPDFGFDTIADGDNVEISGEYDGDVLVASYIEKQDANDDNFEVKGTVENYNGADRFDLLLRNGTTIQVTIAAGAEIPSIGIADGQFVEVEGTIPDPVNAPHALLATEVELEDRDHLNDDGGEAELHGILNFDAETGTWSVRNVPLQFVGTTEYLPASLEERIVDGSAQGLTVEVEGQHLNGVLEVDQIKVEDTELAFEAVVSDISVTDARNGTITLSFGGAEGTVDVVVDNRTLFVDDHPLEPFNLGDIAVGDYLEIDARVTDDGSVRATSLHREDGPDIVIEGPVDVINTVSITVFGITFTIDGSTAMPDGAPDAGQFVELVDENGDGLADVIELED